MSKNTNTAQTLTIASLERLRLSVNGNPRFRVTFTSGLVAQTQTDGSIGYAIENPEYRDVPVVVTFTRAGRIIDVEAAKPATHPRCATLGCTARPTHVVAWYDVDSVDPEREEVCAPCGESYTRRPVLRATLSPLADQPNR